MTTKAQHLVIATKLLGYSPLGAGMIKHPRDLWPMAVPDFDSIEIVERLIFPGLERRGCSLRIDNYLSYTYRCSLYDGKATFYRCDEQKTMSDAIVGATLKYLEGV